MFGILSSLYQRICEQEIHSCSYIGTQEKKQHIFLSIVARQSSKIMTEEGIEHTWKVTVEVGTGELADKFYRKVIGYIEVTENRLYLVDYDCLTMAAQFEDEKVPDQNCSRYKREIENGFYKVEVFQYYDVDHDKYIGKNETDILLHFIKVPVIKPNVEKVFWCIY
ncbi:MAG TPA: hypothetical protein VK061_02835 [Bacillota bacterium]|nr:hypothetical protein [Bacillota bacterium]